MRPNNTARLYSEPVAANISHRRFNAIAGCSLLLLGTQCAVYDNTFETASPLVEADTASATDAPNCGGNESTSATSGVGGQNGGRATTAGEGGTAHKVGDRDPALGEGGSAGSAGDASGGGSDAGSSGQMAGAAGAWTASNVSRGKPTKTDSE